MSINHYENFPVGSLVLPRRLRKPIHAIYRFARTADDIADEGDADATTRLTQLQALRDELSLIEQGQTPNTVLMQRLNQEAIIPFQLPLNHFYDLLVAFEQDVTVTRYQNFSDLINYARHSANPIGRLLLALYGEDDPRSLAYSDGICTALQLINFWQDVGPDWGKGRLYIPLDDLARFGVSEDDIAQKKVNFPFQRLLHHECERAHSLLKAGSPLGTVLKGRLGFELRMIILGGQRILHRIDEHKYDVFNHRPTLNRKDWWHIIKRSFSKK